jgi:hypothetical protein
LKPFIGRLLSAYAIFLAHCRFGGRATYQGQLEYLIAVLGIREGPWTSRRAD